jgi:hypothetical protein
MNFRNPSFQYKENYIVKCKELLLSIASMTDAQIRKQRDLVRRNARKTIESIFTDLYYQGFQPEEIATRQIVRDTYSICQERGITDHYAMLADETHLLLEPLGPFPKCDILSQQDKIILDDATILFQKEFNARRFNDVDTREMIYNGKWRAIELMRDDIRLPASRFFVNSLDKLCTMELINRNLDDYPAANKFKFKGIVNISRLYPASIILPHFGINQSRLRIQIPLSIPKGDCKIFCLDQTRQWETQNSLILNDSYIHMVANNTEQPREVVLVDIQHPHLVRIE